MFLVLAAVLIGRHIESTDHTLFANWPPLWASWDPHAGPGTPAAITVALGVVAYGPVLTARLPWRALLGASWAAAMAWTWSLALIDGWHRGVAVRLTTRYEYLQVIDRFHDIPATLRDFTHHIPLTSPDHWPPHVAGHPPAASLTFVLLDRIGLSGGGWAGTWCITVGATACVAVLVTVRRLADEECARRAAPFLVLAPAAVWMGTSADAYFTAAAAWSVAALTLAATAPKGPRTTVTAFTSGLLFGLTCYLSYGLTLIAVIGAGVLFLARSRVPMLPCLVSRAAFLVAGFAVVPTAFTLAGFHWWEAYPVLVERYYGRRGRYPPLRLLGMGEPRMHRPHHRSRNGHAASGGRPPHWPTDATAYSPTASPESRGSYVEHPAPNLGRRAPGPGSPCSSCAVCSPCSPPTCPA